jgi:hypothetical protein
MKPENTQANMGLYAFYRTLSKHWHFISMQRKENKQIEKAANLERGMNLCKNKVTNLSAKKEVLAAMIEDMNNELAALQSDAQFLNQ